MCDVYLNLKEIVATESTQEETSQNDVVTTETAEYTEMVSHGDTQNITHGDQQMVMTSSGEIMTQDQFNALTTLADMISHEVTAQEQNQAEEFEVEPQVQQVDY